MRPRQAERVVHEPRHVVLDRHVGPHRVHAAAELGALACDALGLVEVARRADHDVGARAGIRECDRPSDAPAAARDDRHLAAQVDRHARRAIPRMCGTGGTGGPGVNVNRSQRSTLNPAASISLSVLRLM